MTAGQNRIPVNLDYAASTPMRAEALLAQREYDDSELAGVNPNSLHSLGRKAAARLEVARREFARPRSSLPTAAPRPTSWRCSVLPRALVSAIASAIV